MCYCIPACRGISQEGSGGEDNPHVSRDAGPTPALLSLGVTSCIPRRTIRSPSPNELLTETEHGSTGAKTQLIAQHGPAHTPHPGPKDQPAGKPGESKTHPTNGAGAAASGTNPHFAPLGEPGGSARLQMSPVGRDEAQAAVSGRKGSEIITQPGSKEGRKEEGLCSSPPTPLPVTVFLTTTQMA